MGNRATPQRGELYEFPGLLYLIKRVDPDLKWVEVREFSDAGGSEVKTVSLPLPIGFRKVS